MNINGHFEAIDRHLEAVKEIIGIEGLVIHYGKDMTYFHHVPRVWQAEALTKWLKEQLPEDQDFSVFSDEERGDE